MSDDRDYIVGATIQLTVAVTMPNSQVPDVASSVILDGLYVGITPVTVSPNTFTGTSSTYYVFYLNTTGFAPGIYTWRARATTVHGFAYKEDTFVLRSRYGT